MNNSSQSFVSPATFNANDLDFRDFLDLPQSSPARVPEIPIETEDLYSTKKSTGRKQIVDTKILNRFESLSKPKPPKKEYLRCKMIRGHKRVNRQIERGIKPKRTLNVFSAKAKSYWDQLLKSFNQYKSILSQESKTEAGPKTDGKTKRKGEENDLPKSFNGKFCRKYFEPIEVRESYFYYTEYVFSEFDPDVLCKKFKLRCCRAPQHSSECMNSWKLLKFYVQKIMFDNLGIEPWMSVESTNDMSKYSTIQSKIVEKGIDEIIDVCDPEDFKGESLCLFKEVDDGDIDPDLFFGL
ncbi:unnamed protein product [Blepharisma stoltei]|uniref:Uncharacterized protein n=1 Tax=Blepharisma stoltei TaxID=1481888 RepID=A0AAU9I7W3_9CILI|nr:unnamed protein product [Blepharisma stoltei]